MDNFISPFATFKYGREDCATTPYTDETFEFPSTHLTHEEVFTYFQEVFGFDKNQVMPKYKGSSTVEEKFSPKKTSFFNFLCNFSMRLLKPLQNKKGQKMWGT